MLMEAYTRGEKWVVECSEGKGMGVIATADIGQGKLQTMMN